MQTCIWPSWCHYHSLSLVSGKSRLVLPFWYWLTQVVPDKGPLNGCMCVCVCVYSWLVADICVYRESWDGFVKQPSEWLVIEWTADAFSQHWALVTKRPVLEPAALVQLRHPYEQVASRLTALSLFTSTSVTYCILDINISVKHLMNISAAM